MNLRIKLFAAARQFAGAESIELELPEGTTIGQLRQALASRAPRLAAIVSHSAFAIDADYASDSAVIPSGADVACIPPVSGG